MKVFELMQRVGKLEKGVNIEVRVFDDEQKKRIELNNEILNDKISKYNFYTIK